MSWKKMGLGLGLLALLAPVVMTAADYKIKAVKHDGIRFAIDYIDYFPSKWEDSTITILKIRIIAPGPVSQIKIVHPGKGWESPKEPSSDFYGAVNLKCMFPAKEVKIIVITPDKTYIWYPFADRNFPSGHIDPGNVRPTLATQQTYDHKADTCN